MKTKLFKISMVMAALIFVFAGASWAENGKKRQRTAGPAKRIESNHQRAGSHRRPAHYKHKINRHQKHFYKTHHPRKRPALQRYRHHKWNRYHRPAYRPGRYYSENSYDDDSSYNEFSLAATISEPGVEFSIGTKRTW